MCIRDFIDLKQADLMEPALIVSIYKKIRNDISELYDLKNYLESLCKVRHISLEDIYVRKDK